MTPRQDISRLPKERLLFEDNRDEFNRLVQAGQAPDLRGANLSGLDLRGAELAGLDLSGAYMRGTNLSGVDLTGCNLAGASMRYALISGTLFPVDVAAEEIRLSLEHGTRIRTRGP